MSCDGPSSSRVLGRAAFISGTHQWVDNYCSCSREPSLTERKLMDGYHILAPTRSPISGKANNELRDIGHAMNIGRSLASMVVLHRSPGFWKEPGLMPRDDCIVDWVQKLSEQDEIHFQLKWFGEAEMRCSATVFDHAEEAERSTGISEVIEDRFIRQNESSLQYPPIQCTLHEGIGELCSIECSQNRQR